MWPDRVSDPGPLAYESGALPIVLRGPAWKPTYKDIRKAMSGATRPFTRLKE